MGRQIRWKRIMYASNSERIEPPNIPIQSWDIEALCL